MEVAGYRIMEKVGAGSFAEVYRAIHIRLEREVALKLLRSSVASDDSFRERFRREAVAAAKIVHPNVASVFDFGDTSDGRAYLALEWVPGKTLEHAIFEQEAFPIERATSILREIALGLASAHRLGMVHRDLKSGNIMLRAADEHGPETVKIVDFGLVRASWDVDRLTKTGQVLGTPQFMAPEVITGAEATAASDIYALGVIAYQVVSGQLPFQGRNPIEIMKRQVTDPVPELPKPSGLAPLIMRMLAKQPDMRPADAGEVIRFVDSLMEASAESETIRSTASSSGEMATPMVVKLGDTITDLKRKNLVTASYPGPSPSGEFDMEEPTHKSPNLPLRKVGIDPMTLVKKLGVVRDTLHEATIEEDVRERFLRQCREIESSLVEAKEAFTFLRIAHQISVLESQVRALPSSGQ